MEQGGDGGRPLHSIESTRQIQFGTVAARMGPPVQNGMMDDPNMRPH